MSIISLCVALIAGNLGVAGVASAQTAPVGQGFHLNPSDLRFILKQIKIAERHAVGPDGQPGTADDPTPEHPRCQTLLGPGPDQIPDQTNQGVELPYGLRTVDGSCNNLIPGQEKYGAADQVFPRKTTPTFRDAENAAAIPGLPAGQTSYKQKSGIVVDSQPRVISNLIVDQTSSNPAAVAAATGEDGVTATPDESGTLFIPNVATDVGLSAPFNSWFTLFGQFFDHGLDLVTKGGGTVLVPLKDDDPLVLGDDGQAGTADDLPPHLRFMALSRATNLPGDDGILGTADDIQEHTNTTTPFVDQNQTYTSHPSHQVFLRDYELVDTDGDGDVEPVATGKMLDGVGGNIGTWSEVKAQAADLLGIELRDSDVLNAPLLKTDLYGRFMPGPNGYPQLMLQDGTLLEGNPSDPVPTTNSLRTGHEFLVDIAHHAVPIGDRDGDQSTPPQPLDPDTDPGTTDDGDRTTYDDEMLAAHFATGDPRGNENIGLTAVHTIFHSEHNRLVDHIKDVLLNEDPESLPDWQIEPGVWNGERLFQAAKFVTEMEYQHLAFEEFARKVQPMINLFGEGGVGYHTRINPAIVAEFAHAVYRFGHSMLTQTVARTNPDGTKDNIALLDAFLNPPAFNHYGGQTHDAAASAGAVVQGMTRQVGSEIDEFVTDALRNNLLGLPLDLPTINMTRARDTGIPPLNSARRQFYAESGNSALAPYMSWADFGFNLKHPESLINFIAAYGTHESLAGPDREVGTADDTATTLAAKRAAAKLLVEADPANANTPTDAADFLNGTGTWANNDNGTTITGVDDIDFWVGGLAEKRMVFGGLLGSTFNYVFERQLENLQNADRFYYLSRTAGLNLLTQLEGNSFAELAMRNTDAKALPADVFSRPALVFDLNRVVAADGSLQDDTLTEEYNEAELLIHMPNGTIRYTGPEHAVFNGTAGPDRMRSSEGDDTLRGNDGNDWMQGGDGVDNFIGGLGDDIMQDIFGDDTFKGGDGDDAISSGQGFGGDLNQGGRDKDFIVGGNDATETFGGPGDDFVFAGDDLDTVFGDDGDDWVEGGEGPFNLLQGDNGAPFQDDPNEPGHDVLDADGGEQDYDAEGGDDIMLAGPGIQRSEGMLGFDWVTHKGDPEVADSDMNAIGGLPPSLDNNRDRFDLVEALSGWTQDDVLRGDDRVANDIVAPGDQPITAGHALGAEGIARIDGLQDLVGAGVTSFSAGNIIIGGAGSDLIEGRGGDDIIDGDRWLDVELLAPDPSTGGTQLVDSMSELRADVFAGRIDPGAISIVRTIKTANLGGDIDTAVFSDVRANYTVTDNADGSITVAHSGGSQVDGTDTLRNVERLGFSDQTITPDGSAVEAPATLTISDMTPSEGQELTATLTPNDGVTLSSVTIDWQVESGGNGFRTIASGDTFTPTDAEVDSALRVRASFSDGRLTYQLSADTQPVGNVNDQPTGTVGLQPLFAGATLARVGTALTVGTASLADGDGLGTFAFSWELQRADGTWAGGGWGETFTPRRRHAGRTLRVVVSWMDDNGSTEEVMSSEVMVADAPAAPEIRRATRGARGRPRTATIRWRRPVDNGGSAIVGYRVVALRMDARRRARVSSRTRSPLIAPDKRAFSFSLRPGTYRFRVIARNGVGWGERSARSNEVRPR